MHKSSLCLATMLCSLGSIPGVCCADDPTTARGYYERGLTHEQNKRYAEALADFSMAIELDAQFTEAYFSRSSLYAGHPSLEKRDYAQAVADLTQLLEIKPKDFSARFNRGLYYRVPARVRQSDQ